MIEIEKRRSDLGRHLIRGTLFNILGLVGKLFQVVFILIATWLFGPYVMGGYALITTVFEIASSAATAGYVDGAIVYAGRYADTANEDPKAQNALNQVIANSFAIPLLISVVLALALSIGADPFVSLVYRDRGGDLVAGLQVASWTLVPLALFQIAISLTKAKHYMEYDAYIGGFLKPVALVGLAVIAKWLDGGLLGLLLAHLGAQCLLAAAALAVVSRHYDLGGALRALLHFRFHRGMFRFALPHNVYLTLDRYVLQLDVMMLGFFGWERTIIAAYWTASKLATALRQVRIVFSGAFGPIAVRHHAARDTQGLQHDVLRISRWVATIVVPVVLALIVMRDDVLRLADESYAGHGPFFAILLIAPLLNCAFGLSVNTMVYTGHTMVSMWTGVIVALLNTAMNWLLIPPLGLIGAATATTVATALAIALQVSMLRRLEGVRFVWREIYHPLLGFAAGAALVLALWDPAEWPDLRSRLAMTFAVALLSLVVMYLVGHPEVRTLAGRIRGSRFASGSKT
jgi:O-antigen/teichoic acid export membrane protein